LHNTIKIKIAYPDSLGKANNNHRPKQPHVDVVAFPGGLIQTTQAIRHNIESKKANHLNAPDDYLRSFTLSKIEQIETCKDNKKITANNFGKLKTAYDKVCFPFYWPIRKFYSV